MTIAHVGLMEASLHAHFVQAEIHNSGELMIEPAIWFEFYDAAGNLYDRLKGQPVRIYPNGKNLQFVSVNDFDPGDYEVLLVVDAGGENIFGAQYTVVVR